MIFFYFPDITSWLRQPNIGRSRVDVDVHSMDRSRMGSQHEKSYHTSVVDAMEGMVLKCYVHSLHVVMFFLYSQYFNEIL